MTKFQIYEEYRDLEHILTSIYLTHNFQLQTKLVFQV